MKRLLLVGATLFAGWWTPVAAQEPGQQLYVITHVDLLGPAAAAAGAQMLQQFAADSRKEKGSVRFEILREASRINHLTVVEVWQTRQDFENHLAQAHAKSFRDKIQPLLGSPFDERLHIIMP